MIGKTFMMTYHDNRVFGNEDEMAVDWKPAERMSIKGEMIDWKRLS